MADNLPAPPPIFVAPENPLNELLQLIENKDLVSWAQDNPIGAFWGGAMNREEPQDLRKRLESPYLDQRSNSLANRLAEADRKFTPKLDRFGEGAYVRNRVETKYGKRSAQAAAALMQQIALFYEMAKMFPASHKLMVPAAESFRRAFPGIMHSTPAQFAYAPNTAPPSLINALAFGAGYSRGTESNKIK